MCCTLIDVARAVNGSSLNTGNTRPACVTAKPMPRDRR